MQEEKKNYELAYDDYLKGLKQKEIAEKYNVSLSAVKSWKNRYWNKWDTEKRLQPKTKKVATKTTKSCNPKRSRGGQPNNKNSVGNKGNPQPHNQNNYKHGLFAKLMYDTLPDDVKELMTDLEINTEKELIISMRLCDTEILRLFKLMKQAEEKPGGLFINKVSKTDKQIGEKPFIKQTTTDTVSANDLILKYRNEIQKYIKQRVRCLEGLIKLGFDTERLELEKKRIEENASGDGNIDKLVATIEQARKARGE